MIYLAKLLPWEKNTIMESSNSAKSMYIINSKKICYKFYNILIWIHYIHDFGRNAMDSMAFLSECNCNVFTVHFLIVSWLWNVHMLIYAIHRNFNQLFLFSWVHLCIHACCIQKVMRVKEINCEKLDKNDIFISFILIILCIQSFLQGKNTLLYIKESLKNVRDYWKLKCFNIILNAT